jgi:imidazolonepropionase-like amidohydrolase
MKELLKELWPTRDETAEIHRAKWVVPICAPPVHNGGVLVRSGRVLAAGPFTDIRKRSPAGVKMVDHGRSALLPALVNAHTHLELSWKKEWWTIHLRSFRAFFPS